MIHAINSPSYRIVPIRKIKKEDRLIAALRLSQ